MLTFHRLKEDHKKWKEEEATVIESDRSTTGPKGGLFRGCFRSHPRRPVFRARPIRDAEDGVERCPSCTWELEDGHCESCGYPYEEDTDYISGNGEMGYSDLEYGSGDEMDDDVMEALAEDDFVHHLEHHAYEGGHYNLDGIRENLRLGVHPRTIRQGPGYRFPDIIGDESLSPGVYRDGPPFDDFVDDTDYDSEADEGSSSLEGFVVNDEDANDHSRGSSVGSVQWETEEGSGPEEGQTLWTDDDHTRQIDNNFEQDEAPFANAHHTIDEDSDDGPIAPNSRRQTSRMVAGRNRVASHEGLQGSSARRNEDRQIIFTPSNQRILANRSPVTTRRTDRSRGVPIQIASDSDSSVPPQRQRRRRPRQTRLSSDDEREIDASSSTVLGPLSRPGPIRGESRRQKVPATRTSDALTPVVLISDGAESEDDDTSVLPHQHQPQSPTASDNETPLLARSGDPTASSTRRIIHGTSVNHRNPSSQMNHRQSHLLQSPLPPRANGRGSSRPSISPMRQEERLQQGVRDRQERKAAKKAERRRLKAERDRRHRVQAGPSNTS